MRRGGAIAAVLALLFVAPAHGAPEHAEIAFMHRGEIWAARADGSERRLLVEPTQRRERLADPVWSPDGSKLVYVSTVGERSRLMLLDAAGSRAVTDLRRGAGDFTPAWSPDGTRLAFMRITQSGERYRTSIVVRDLATGTERELVGESLLPRFRQVGEPAWSPDGATIAYTWQQLDREHDFRPQIRVMPAAGGASRILIRDAQSPAWSSTGRLAFASVRDRNGKICGSDECHFAGEIYTAAADGSDQRRLTRNAGSDVAPTWSPDGSRILFTSDRNLPEQDSAEVYSVAPDGSCLTWITNGTPASHAGTFRPGTGSRYDPGSCDPDTRAPLIDAPQPRPMRGALWLGVRYRGLVLSDVRRGVLSYADCARFEGCPPPIHLVSEPACRMSSFRGLAGNGYRYFRRNGALVAYYSPLAGVRVLSGHALTSVELGDGNRLAAVEPVLRSLRTFGGARPQAPRVPRALIRRLEDGSPLQRALRSFGPYRVSTCEPK